MGDPGVCKMVCLECVQGFRPSVLSQTVRNCRPCLKTQPYAVAIHDGGEESDGCLRRNEKSHSIKHVSPCGLLLDRAAFTSSKAGSRIVSISPRHNQVCKQRDNALRTRLTAMKQLQLSIFMISHQCFMSLRATRLRRGKTCGAAKA